MRREELRDYVIRFLADTVELCHQFCPLQFQCSVHEISEHERNNCKCCRSVDGMWNVAGVEWMDWRRGRRLRENGFGGGVELIAVSDRCCCGGNVTSGCDFTFFLVFFSS